MTKSNGRVDPRFITGTRVEVRLPDRQEFATFWMENVSRGGMFVRTGTPPSRGTRVEVKLETPDGDLLLHAEIVHVIDRKSSREIEHPPGVGLRFVEISPELAAAVDGYIHGPAREMEKAQRPAEPVDDTGRMITLCRHIKACIDRSELYAALGADPSAAKESLIRHFAKLRAALLNPPASTNTAQRERFTSVAQDLEEVADVLLDDERRLEHDFRHGHPRAEARIEAARNGGPSVDRLREVWTSVHPEKMENAERYAVAALEQGAAGDLARAESYGQKALELDPFNEPLRSMLDLWSGSRVCTRPSARPADLRAGQPK